MLPAAQHYNGINTDKGNGYKRSILNPVMFKYINLKI